MKLIQTSPLLLLLCACPVSVIDTMPCRPCNVDCDDGTTVCDDCRAENCPDMTEEMSDD